MNDAVYALALDGAGNFYAGGTSPLRRGQPNYIAKWDGTTWSALGSGINDSVFTLALDDAGNLYAGGLFHHGRRSRRQPHRQMEWHGLVGPRRWHEWRRLALALDGAGNLYAGGWFRTAGGVSTTVAKWNGTAWSALGSGMNTHVYALAVDSTGHVYAGGSSPRRAESVLTTSPRGMADLVGPG